MEGRTVLVTGSTDGLGRQVARELARSGATVLIHGRDAERGERVLEELGEAGGGEHRLYLADFASLDGVRHLAADVEREHERVHVLVNNAGMGAAGDRTLTADGHELRFQVNHLAGFLLTGRLLPVLRRSAPARIVNVSSLGQYPLDFDDVMLEHGYTGTRAYSQSKLAQIMFTFELAARLEGSGVTVTALHPATYMDTTMVREAGVTAWSTVEQGAEATLRLIASPELDGVSGRFFDGLHEGRPDAQAYDAGARARLWEISEELTGRPFGF
jgi:NAD(P)-dependent dehydrogenase (short-subunit alcohol dehydrogenase family)